MNNRGRTRSQAQRAGTAYAYMNTTNDLIENNLPAYTSQPPQSFRRRIVPGAAYPPYSDTNLLLQSEDWIRAGLFYRAHEAYNHRLDPIPYIEKQLGPYDL